MSTRLKKAHGFLNAADLLAKVEWMVKAPQSTRTFKLAGLRDRVSRSDVFSVDLSSDHQRAQAQRHLEEHVPQLRIRL
jgi:hypothetical protein